MERKRAERLTSPAIAVAVIASVILIAVDPRQALLILSGAELVVGVGSAVHVRTSLRQTPPARPSAIVFAVIAAFWIVMSVLSAGWYIQDR